MIVPELPKYLRIIYPQGIHISEVYNSTFISNFHYGYGIYEELKSKEDNSGWKEAKPVESVYIEYEPKNSNSWRYSPWPDI